MLKTKEANKKFQETSKRKHSECLLQKQIKGKIQVKYLSL